LLKIGAGMGRRLSLSPIVALVVGCVTVIGKIIFFLLRKRHRRVAMETVLTVENVTFSGDAMDYASVYAQMRGR
jgi:hypothetical protein